MSENIFRQSCLLQLNTSCWTGSKALEPWAMERLGDSDWLRGKKHLVDPEYLAPIKTTCMKARKFLSKHALPFPLTTLTLVPKECVTRIENGLKELEVEYWDKVAAFTERYEMAREEAQNVLGSLFRDTDYPLNIRDKFRFEWRYVIIDLPNEASILPPEIYEREKEKFVSMMDETRDLAILALREEFASLIGHMVDRLSLGEDGKPKILRSSMVENLNEFLASFEERNVFGDDRLLELINQAKAVVNEVQSPYALKYNELLRKRVSDEMTRLKLQVDKAIEDLPRRKIRLPEPSEVLEAA
ncbi:Protein of unknown function (DUF3150) [Desulfocurvibacter africanus PCS]|uniref:Uncharacterized protein n=1 Tax=Desulfocurvibacter africanus PCS TaxID=1262666 RepID=M5Q101_DESAF|nr:DUF3150 domain-containing protein [Desulfocurvibacter africanus]EMG37146.1 Protein of unknown function (DUF3150) [Desulfocurvibacter africanus PCS]